MVARARQFLSHVVPGIIKPMRVLWNEVIGFLFVCLGLVPIPSGIRAWREFDKGNEGPFRVLLTVVFCVVMLYFGITSFLKARNISRT
ncbi:MAG: hypothetical protein HY235_06990 [Acidobacteria bacterium]|nr:hypothetical protein [Acidobacteriota bacterium]